jgi:hypothetical protein
MTTDADGVRDGWHRFLIEAVLLKDHATFYALLNARPGMANPVVDRFAPGILYVKMVALLDEGLSAYLEREGLRIVAPYRKTLEGRISFLQDQRRLKHGVELHLFRELRNGLAHEPHVHTNWAELDSAIVVVQSELEHLGLVGARPNIQPFAERGQANIDHGLPGVAMIQDYVIGAKIGDDRVAEISWSLKTYRFGWDEARVEDALARGETPPTGLK